ncbi:ABC transporter permease [Pseudothermotoga sp.]|nr:ABC transporter permease [Pseudothermotoga sp.]MCX7812050.1 ABC transporter permease [Pseudothermotoga sp.]MDW8139120.1 ABC transporter permease [Pseudothermotoga sp.]
MYSIVVQLLHAALSSATPINLAALGGMFSFHANVFNIAMEGMMLMGAYYAVYGAYTFGHWFYGVLFALISGIVLALIFSIFVIVLKVDEFITGIGINMLALGWTTYSLRATFHVKGAFISQAIPSIPRVSVPFVEKVPIMKEIFSSHPFLVFVSIISAFVCHVALYRTRFGLRLRASGEEPSAVASVGLSSSTLKLWSVILCGLLSSMAGVYLSLGYVTLFAENMSNGRGWISLAIIILVRGKPGPIMFMSLIFGLLENLGLLFQRYAIPPQFTAMLPYVATLFVLYSYARRARTS